MSAKPSEQLNDILSGKILPAGAPEPIQSWLSFVCYRIAVDMIGMTREQQRLNVSAYSPAVLDIIRGWYKQAQKNQR